MAIWESYVDGWFILGAIAFCSFLKASEKQAIGAIHTFVVL
jgi:hypothetical protein